MRELFGKLKDFQEPSETPEQIVERIQALRDTLGTLMPLTPAEKKKLRNGLARSEDVLQARINLVGMDDAIAEVVAPAEEIRALNHRALRWSAVETELRKLLEGVEGANLYRRYRAAMLASQGAQIGRALARDPEKTDLTTQLEHLRNLNRAARRRKSRSQEETESPETASS